MGAFDDVHNKGALTALATADFGSSSLSVGWFSRLGNSLSIEGSAATAGSLSINFVALRDTLELRKAATCQSNLSVGGVTKFGNSVIAAGQGDFDTLSKAIVV
jgi:hypothetical protein